MLGAGVPIPGPPMGGGGPAAGTTVGDAVAPLSSAEVVPRSRSGWRSSVCVSLGVPPAEVWIGMVAAAAVVKVMVDVDEVDGGKRGRSVVTSLLLTVVVVGLLLSVSSSPVAAATDEEEEGEEGEGM
jgi:hypothetical protein